MQLLVRLALVIAAAAAAVPVLPAEEIALSASSRVQVVYFSAPDCPYCQRFEAPRGSRAAFLASKLAREVEFYDARRASLGLSPSIANVPPPVKWIWDKAWIPRATPAWVVTVDDTVVLSVAGLGYWEGQVRPLIEQLVERRDRLRQAQR